MAPKTKRARVTQDWILAIVMGASFLMGIAYLYNDDGASFGPSSERHTLGLTPPAPSDTTLAASNRT